MSIDGKITVRQMAWLVVTIRTAVVIVGIPAIWAGVGKDAWIAELAGTGIMIGMAWVVVTLGRRFPQKSLLEIGWAILGKYLGFLLGLGVLWFFLFVTASLTRQLGEFVVTVFFPETPIIVFILFLTAVNAYAVHMGLESIARINDILFFIVILMFGLFWLFVIQNVDFTNILPVFAESGLLMIAKGGVVAASEFMLVVAIGMIFPYLNQQGRALPMIIIGLLLQGLIIAGTTVLVIGVLGVNQAEMVNFHGMSLSRVIEVADFLEKLDAVFMTVWVSSTFIKTALFYLCFILGLGQLLNLGKVKLLIIPTGALIMALAMASYDSLPQLRQFFIAGLVIHNWVFIFFIPTGLLLLAVMLKKKEG